MKIEELPTGRSIVDIVYIPDRNVYLPALLIELKWNEAETSAMGQIKSKHYLKALENYFVRLCWSVSPMLRKTKNISIKLKKFKIRKALEI